ncbi:cache domain-containing protein [Alphaproteobacteria bacterium KMM 3653]|uniref:histidine kinase n=1 Tax=Harenicola maris TaxID=2841044 RepID=A0AAP2G7S1_9RHOB|nr:cache domain-containing protein [Harenicola maris]
MRLTTLSYAQKLFLLATVPLILAVGAITGVVAHQSRVLAQSEIEELEHQLLEAKKRELRNYMAIARAAIQKDYGSALPDDEQAKVQVIQTLAALLYGQDGFFFVYDYEGTNLVSPRQTYLINKNWLDLTDEDGAPIVEELLDRARSGGGFHSYLWEKPSTGEKAQMISYVIGLQDWRWAIGTGIFVDDVRAVVLAARAETESRVRATFFGIAAITLGALMIVFLSGQILNIRERRLADTKLKALTQRILDTQEEERGRVARELHDGISQTLVGVRYVFDLARRQIAKGNPKGEEALDSGIEALSGAIGEVRRISRDLRPGVLDDLGLGPALKALVEDFATRTGITTEFETAVFRNRLDQDGKITLYRIAQEALTNIERHAEASHVTLKVFGHKHGATLRITDDGRGLGADARRTPGLGLRNMAERIEQIGGTLDISSSKSGTSIDAVVPLSHILSPSEEGPRRSTPEPQTPDKRSA